MEELSKMWWGNDVKSWFINKFGGPSYTVNTPTTIFFYLVDKISVNTAKCHCAVCQFSFLILSKNILLLCPLLILRTIWFYNLLFLPNLALVLCRTMCDCYTVYIIYSGQVLIDQWIPLSLSSCCPRVWIPSTSRVLYYVTIFWKINEEGARIGPNKK